ELRFGRSYERRLPGPDGSGQPVGIASSESPRSARRGADRRSAPRSRQQLPDESATAKVGPAYPYFPSHPTITSTRAGPEGAEVDTTHELPQDPSGPAYPLSFPPYPLPNGGSEPPPLSEYTA